MNGWLSQLFKVLTWGSLFGLTAICCGTQFVLANEPQRPAIQLASRYHQDIEFSEYLVSEKLDGVRARWDGNKLISRGGHMINAPQWFTSDFPNVTLDGELWIARNAFDEVSAIARRKSPIDKQWRKVAFHVFDLPLSAKPFGQRYRELSRLLLPSNNSSSPYIKLIPHKKMISRDALMAWLDKVVELDGEGLMLHHQDALYQHKRSKQLLKLKKRYDAEAQVIGYVDGKGKYRGKVGALLMRTADGIEFKLGSGLTDALRENPPPIGSLVTYQYLGKTKTGKPRFSSYLRVRK